MFCSAMPSDRNWSGMLVAEPSISQDEVRSADRHSTSGLLDREGFEGRRIGAIDHLNHQCVSSSIGIDAKLGGDGSTVHLGPLLPRI
jgi:hypothetical protein